MDIDSLSKQTISNEDIAAEIDFTADFSRELQRYKGRLTGTAQETACARAIRSRLEAETDTPVRMEAFKAKPALGRGCFFMLGIWFLLSYALYYVSFAGGRLVGILLTLVALFNFAIGSVIILLLFLGNKKLSGILSDEISYNVVGECCKNRDRDVKERVIVIADHHDAVQGSILRDYGLIRRLTVLLCPISAAVFVLFCILKMAIGTESPDASVKISVFTVVPAVLGVMGVVATLFHYSPFARHAKIPNGLSICTAMATYAYFAEQPELLPDDVRLVYASFGGENSAHSGAEAFIKAHPEFHNAAVICIGDVSGSEVKIAEYDPIRRLEFSTQLTSSVSGVAHEQGVEISTIPHRTLLQALSQLHGYPSTAFAKHNVRSTTLMSLGEYVDDKTESKMFKLAVGTVFRLFDDIPVQKDGSSATSLHLGQAEMRAISSK